MQASAARISGPPELPTSATRRPRGSGVRAGAPDAGDRSPGLQSDDGFLTSDATCDPEELPCVAERLEVQRDDPGGGVVLPEAQQVVAADVDLVAHRDEVRDADPGTGGLLEQDDPDSSRLRVQPNPPRHRCDRRERRVAADVRIRAAHAQAVRPDDPHARAPGHVEQLVLERGTGTSGFAETRGDDDEGTQTGRGRLLHHPEDLGRRHDDDTEVDWRRELADRGKGADTTDRSGLRVHRVDDPSEVAGEECPDDLVADPTRAPPGPDHGDRARPEERGDTRGRRDTLALLAAGEIRLRRREVESHLHNALDEPARLAHPGILEHLEHDRVLGGRLGAELIDPLLPRVGRERLEQQRPHPASLELLGDDERDVGVLLPRQTDVTGHPDQCVSDQRDECHCVDVVDSRQCPELSLAGLGHRAEHPHIRVLGR